MRVEIKSARDLRRARETHQRPPIARQQTIQLSAAHVYAENDRVRGAAQR